MNKLADRPTYVQTKNRLTDIIYVQGEQLKIAVFFWYLGKSNLSSVHMYSSVHWKSIFLQDT